MSEHCQKDCLISVRHIASVNTTCSTNELISYTGECSKSSAGFYESPEKLNSNSSSNDIIQNEASDSDDDSDAEEQTEQDTNAQAEKHYAQILQIVNNKMAKASRKNAVTGTAVTVAPIKDVNQNGTSFDDDTTNAYEASSESEMATTNHFPSEMSVGAIKTQVVRHILSVINTGTYDEVIHHLHTFLFEWELRHCFIRRLHATITLFFLMLYRPVHTFSRFWRCVALARYVRCAFLPNATPGTPLAPSKTLQTV